jgi:hypothetical protein
MLQEFWYSVFSSVHRTKRGHGRFSSARISTSQHLIWVWCVSSGVRPTQACLPPCIQQSFGRKTLINNFVPFKCSIMSPGGLVAWLLLRLKVDCFFTWVSCFPFLVFCCSLSMLLLWFLFKKNLWKCAQHISWLQFRTKHFLWIVRTVWP